MPPLALHTFIAKQVADRLNAPLLEAERGNLYLGSTAPDIRVITRWDRERTHFFNLENFDEQSGVEGLFRSHPEISDVENVSGPVASFVAGYITHLVTDEAWIELIYRPFFGKRSPMGGSLQANIMDRALQFSLDAQRRNDTELVTHVVGTVARDDLDMDVGVVDLETLRDWKRIVLEFVNSRPDWERFRQGALRHLHEAGVETDDGFAEMTASLPDLVDETVRYLTPQRIDEWMDESLEECVRAVKEYLSCA